MMVAPEMVAPGRKNCARKAWRSRHPPHHTSSMARPLSAFHTSANSALNRRVSSSVPRAGAFTRVLQNPFAQHQWSRMAAPPRKLGAPPIDRLQSGLAKPRHDEAASTESLLEGPVTL